MSLTQTGPTLLIACGRADDHVLVIDRGDGTLGVVANEAAPESFTGVARLKCTDAGGDMTLDIVPAAGSDRSPALQEIDVTTRSGRDHVGVVVGNGAHLAVSTSGGNDEVLVTLDGRTDVTVPGMPIRKTVGLEIATGTGDDRVVVTSNGSVNSSLSVNVALEGGNDSFDASFSVFDVGFPVFDSDPDFSVL